MRSGDKPCKWARPHWLGPNYKETWDAKNYKAPVETQINEAKERIKTKIVRYCSTIPQCPNRNRACLIDYRVGNITGHISVEAGFRCLHCWDPEETLEINVESLLDELRKDKDWP